MLVNSPFWGCFCVLNHLIDGKHLYLIHVWETLDYLGWEYWLDA